ncbi:YppE family protein [Solibacillus silvestris]|uniref:YppE family protein n=1 Tax=Solibacillus silvestris TaxID=76853 RepID=UPI003F7CEAB2
MQLLDETNKLIEECEACLHRFQEMRRLDMEPDFFADVKPHADYMHTLIQEWQQLANRWIKNKHPKNLYVQQIDHAADAMEQFVVQSFYKGTSKKRFIQSIQSAQYTLKLLVSKIEEGEDIVK